MLYNATSNLVLIVHGECVSWSISCQTIAVAKR